MDEGFNSIKNHPVTLQVSRVVSRKGLSGLESEVFQQ
jgi:hypothetical protein